jgi:hypothetical protein
MLVLGSAISVVGISAGFSGIASQRARAVRRPASGEGRAEKFSEQLAATAACREMSDAVAEELVMGLCGSDDALARTNELFHDLAASQPLWWMEDLPDG